jgi:putative transposase
MPASCVVVYIHYVWATWDREPLLTSEVEAGVYAMITEKCRALGCDRLAIGGTEDHVHVMVRLHAAVAVAELAKAMKGSSSHLATHRLVAPEGAFKWQGSYGAFSVSHEHLGRVRDYINRQKEHHAQGDLDPDWERCYEIADAI